MEVTEEARWLSPVEELLVRAASVTEWRHADDLCTTAGLLADGEVPSTIRAILANLSDRNILISGGKKGYRLKPRLQSAD